MKTLLYYHVYMIYVWSILVGNLPMKVSTQTSPLCGPDWIYSSNFCYQVVRENKKWEEARTHCLQKNADLLFFSNMDELNTLKDVLTQLYYTTGIGPYFWIGANDKMNEGTFVRADNSPLSVTNWGPGEPNNAGGVEDCVELYMPQYLWNDKGCGNGRYPICKKLINECSNDPCKNGGTCKDLVNAYECECVAGYEGKNCDNDIDECSSDPCKNGGTCKNLVNGYECTCIAGYDGTTCDNNKNDCENSPCQNGGSCTDLVNSYKCTCVNGYEGTNCQTDINECSTDPCKNGGICKDLVNAYECECVAGYDGKNCDNDINECSTDPCKNGGTCKDLVNAYECECVAGYDGKNCDNDIDECSSDPCKNGGTCNDLVNGYECTCIAGYDGTTCDNNINDCENNPCQNGGSCTDLVNGYKCTCVNGYEGTNCQTDINECSTDPCKNGGTCKDLVNAYECECVAGYEGKNCDNDKDECSSDPCKNGGTCKNLVIGYECTCVAGYDGTTCDNNIDECSNDPCKNGGTCTDLVNGYECECVPGYDTDECHNDINECSSNPCKNGGTCTDLVNKYECTCAAGYNGTNCDNTKVQYRCNPDDSINVFNLPEDSYLFAMQVVTDGKDIPCTVHDENATTVTLTGCSKDRDIIITYGPHRELATHKLHSGKSVVIKFVCLEIAEEGVIHTVNSSYSAQMTIDEQISVDPLYSVTASLSETSTTVGSEIIWTIHFPELYSLEVSSCTAYPGTDDSSIDNVNLIFNSGCSAVTDIISDFNSYSNGTASAKLQAFKFYNYDSVFLTCNLKVCPSGTAPTACLTTCSRQKRSVQTRASERQRSMVPMTISNVLYVADSSGTLECVFDFTTTTILTLIIVFSRDYLLCQ